MRQHRRKVTFPWMLSLSQVHRFCLICQVSWCDYESTKVQCKQILERHFFMISVTEEDRRFLRFVWFTTEEKIEIWRLKKLPFGVNCSPFVLNAVIRHHLRQEEDACTSESVRQIIRTLLESFYVDDCLTSLPSTKDADVFKETSIALMANAGMEQVARK